jgi:hypothetical protein
VLVPGVAAQPISVSCSAADPRCPIYGDVDGDGARDRVSVRRLGPCRFSLVVRTAQRIIEAPLRPPCGKPSEVWPSGFPRVIALRPMDGHRGLEPEVMMWHGASNYGVRFFTARGRRLVPMRIEPETGLRDEWNVGGFAEAFSLHDCTRPHVVGVLSVYWFKGKYTEGGETYAVDGTRFVRTAVRARRARRLGSLHAVWPRVPGDDFAHCGGIVRERP